MEKRELVYMDAKSSKFWRIELDGDSHTVVYGRTGTDGQSKTKSFDSPEAAKKDFDKMVASKLKKGYVEESSGADTGGDSEGLPFASFHSVLKQADIFNNVKTFVGLKVVEYDPDKGASQDGRFISKFLSDWEEDNLMEHLEHFVQSDAAEHAVGLVIGNWSGDDPSQDCEPIVKFLVKNANSLPKLRALYLGDIVQEENEISWIQQTDVSPLLKAFPSLEMFRVRGGEELEFKKPQHENLRGLAIETGGLSRSVLQSIGKAKFPNLEFLELWLGTEEYGADTGVEDLQPILTGKLFPKLKYLGLRNSDMADDIASVVVNSPVAQQVESLDLSLGTMTDDGAESLLSLTSDSIKKLSVHRNFLSTKLTKQLKGLPFSVDASGQEAEDGDWRFVAVGE